MINCQETWINGPQGCLLKRQRESPPQRIRKIGPRAVNGSEAPCGTRKACSRRARKASHSPSVITRIGAADGKSSAHWGQRRRTPPGPRSYPGRRRTTRCPMPVRPAAARARAGAARSPAGYLKSKAAYLRYDTALTEGFPIATGISEGACRHLVKDRLGITGARWGLSGAEAVLKLRALRSNGDFDAYWAWHETQEFTRNHQARYRDTLIPAA
jgi:hypothetical protein